MNGSMYCTEWISWLSEPDPTKFEKRFINWSKRTKGKDVMLFDQSTIVVGNRTLVDNERFIYQIELTQIILEYICVNEDMCILRRVFMKTHEGNTELYQMPNCWNGTIPWYAY